jgi:hypothetical protein
MLSAANLGLEDTNSSQFFITVAPCSSLDGHHTCFGKVLRGYSTVKEVRGRGREGGGVLGGGYTNGGGVCSASNSMFVPRCGSHQLPCTTLVPCFHGAIRCRSSMSTCSTE